VHYIRTEELGENEIIPAALVQEIEEEESRTTRRLG
jgi:hypothetical protein